MPQPFDSTTAFSVVISSQACQKAQTSIDPSGTQQPSHFKHHLILAFSRPHHTRALNSMTTWWPRSDRERRATWYLIQLNLPLPVTPSLLRTLRISILICGRSVNFEPARLKHSKSRVTCRLLILSAGRAAASCRARARAAARVLHKHTLLWCRISGHLVVALEVVGDFDFINQQ